jgi:hypothetical protein
LVVNIIIRNNLYLPSADQCLLGVKGIGSCREENGKERIRTRYIPDMERGALVLCVFSSLQHWSIIL